MNLVIIHQGFVKKIISNAVITSIDTNKSMKVTAMWDTGATNKACSGNGNLSCIFRSYKNSGRIKNKRTSVCVFSQYSYF